MINFLKKQRNNLIQSKFGKYSIYAIGEIFLVVIGILIALQVNNWNENRKNLIKEQVILKQLRAEFKSNLVQLDEKIVLRSQIINSSEKVLKMIDNPLNVNKDTLYDNLSVLTLDPTFDPISNDLIVSGNLQLINNLKLKNSLSNWTSDVMTLREMELEWQKMTLNVNFPFIIRLNIYRDLANNQYKNKSVPIYILDKNVRQKLEIGKSKRSVNVESVLNNPEIESIISRAITANHVTNLQSLALKKKINNILDLIEKEIKK